MVGPMTFLQIVNRAIKESKTTLDELTAANFADPPRTILYSRFKDWINTAYKELMMDRPEWFFRQERAIVTIYPRLYLTNLATEIIGGAGEESTTQIVLQIGDTLEAQSSGVQVTVVGIFEHEEIENNNLYEATVEVLPVEGFELNHLLIGETFDRILPTAELEIAKLGGVGRYAFEELQPGLHAINPDTVKVHRTPAEAALANSTYGSNNFPVEQRQWYHWPVDYDMYPWAGPRPTYIVQTPQGSYGLYPQPEEEMLLSFDYTRKLGEMSSATDVPEALPDDMHMYLVWKAVEEFADFDRNQEIFSRARKHVTKYETILQRDYLPKFKWAPNRFYYE